MHTTMVLVCSAVKNKGVRRVWEWRKNEQFGDLTLPNEEAFCIMMTAWPAAATMFMLTLIVR